jgi:tellurite resistance protein
LPQKLMPTLFILIAPPAVAFISLTVLNNWEITTFAKMLFYFAIFMFVIILSKINVFSKLNFFMSWWAYSFPMAVITTATILFYSKTNIQLFYYLGILFYFILWFIMFILIYQTYLWFKEKKLCVEE